MSVTTQAEAKANEKKKKFHHRGHGEHGERLKKIA